MSWEGWLVQRVNVLRALNCDQIRHQGLLCRLCLPGYGKAFTGNNECAPCVDNTYAGSEDGGICRSCSVGYVADRNRVSCSLDTSFVLLASGLFLIVSCWALMLPALLGFRLSIEDFSHQAGKGVVVAMTSKHFLLSRCGWMEVRFSDTGVPWLDVKDAENPASHAYCVLPISHRKLLLRDVSANLPSQTDTSCGKLWINFPRSFVAVGVFQIPFIFLFACCTGSAFTCIVYFQGTERLWPMLCSSSRNVWQRCARIKEFSCWSWAVNQRELNPWNSSIIFKVIFANGTCTTFATICCCQWQGLRSSPMRSLLGLALCNGLWATIGARQSLRKHAETSGMASDEWQARRGREV